MAEDVQHPDGTILTSMLRAALKCIMANAAVQVIKDACLVGRAAGSAHLVPILRVLIHDQEVKRDADGQDADDDRDDDQEPVVARQHGCTGCSAGPAPEHAQRTVCYGPIDKTRSRCGDETMSALVKHSAGSTSRHRPCAGIAKVVNKADCNPTVLMRFAMH